MGWQPIETAPKDGTDILVWFNHEAAPYHDDAEKTLLSDYAANAESGDFMDGIGACIAAWQPSFFETIDEYGAGYMVPAFWFARENGDYERVVYPTHWMPLTPPEAAA